MLLYKDDFWRKLQKMSVLWNHKEIVRFEAVNGLPTMVKLSVALN